MASINSPYNFVCFLHRAIFPSTQSRISQKLIKITALMVAQFNPSEKRTQAKRLTNIERTETPFDDHPRLINKYVNGKDAFRTHNLTHHELFEFFLTGKESIIYLNVYVIIYFFKISLSIVDEIPSVCGRYTTFTPISARSSSILFHFAVPFQSSPTNITSIPFSIAA